ncbi:D-glycero-beta-D-manno-heptose-7-phosphate kinase [Candidatus Marinamargulisbacteria bacterium SCGC AG-343-D04]|nr:D-glycero-beta-D-manno-heptose-7-phosphate kinase [Candidatus Marinamargulisbacteria bacterium SCGC AG-343-D04]
MDAFSSDFSRKLIANFSSLSILVVGDVMLDEYHWCDVKRISPEAPVPICKVTRTTLAPGGAANVAANIASLGGNVDLCGIIGSDSSGERLSQLLLDHNVNTSGLAQTKHPTILKSRIIAKNQHVVRVDRDDHDQLSDDDRHEVFTYISSRISSVNAIVISDYLKGLLTDTFTRSLISLAKKHGCKVIIDPKGNDYSKYTDASIITPNYSEFCQATHNEYSSEDAIRSAALSFKKELNISSMIITRSEKGMTIIDDKECITIPTHALDVFDITGAGDTVIAVLTLCLVSGLEIKYSAIIANIAAGLVVSKVGTAHVSPSELETQLIDYGSSH